jgi:hypothetical protein
MIYNNLDGTIHFFEAHIISEGLIGVQGPEGIPGPKGPVGDPGPTGPASTLEGYEGWGAVCLVDMADSEIYGNIDIPASFTKQLDILNVLSSEDPTLFTLAGGYRYIVDAYLTSYGAATTFTMHDLANTSVVGSVVIPDGLGGKSINKILAPDQDTTYYFTYNSAGAYVGVSNSYVSIIKLGAGFTGETGASPQGAAGATGATGPTGPTGPPAPLRSAYSDYY